jgi:hypothetical protein
LPLKRSEAVFPHLIGISTGEFWDLESDSFQVYQKYKDIRGPAETHLHYSYLIQEKNVVKIK